MREMVHCNGVKIARKGLSRQFKVEGYETADIRDKTMENKIVTITGIEFEISGRPYFVYGDIIRFGPELLVFPVDQFHFFDVSKDEPYIRIWCFKE